MNLGIQFRVAENLLRSARLIDIDSAYDHRCA